MKHLPYGLFGMLLLGALWVPQGRAANIIGFADNATGCGGSTLCSTDGTTGYRGTLPFDLSTITQWFQIDTDGTSHLAGQPVEPNGGAGDFLVVNNTGAVVTSFSLTITDTFTSSSPAATSCTGLKTGQECENFQIHEGAANYFTTGTLTGPDCDSACGTNSANFAPNMVTYNWSGGAGVPVGATFDLNFASWNNTIFANTAVINNQQGAVPEPSSIVLLFSLLAITFATLRKRTARRT